MTQCNHRDQSSLSEKLTRRSFLARTGGLAACFAIPELISRDALASPGRPGVNDRIGVAGIGMGRRGNEVLRNVLKDQRTVPIGVCDVWKSRAEKLAGDVKAPFVCQDYRAMIDRKDVDAIVTATPEHWRSLICVNAALAGKHLYVEKPITLTLEDGVLMRKAARKTGICFQCGSMQRSMVPNYLGCKLIREGKLGAIKEIWAANYESPWLCGLPEETIPEGLDWNMWCGPSDPVPFNQQLFVPRGNPGWLSFRPYSGGEMTGWGTHGFDQIQCAMDFDATGPVEILVEGDRLEPPTYDKPESAERGNSICSSPKLAFRYENGLTVYLDSRSNRGGAIFTGTEGKMEIFRNRIVSNPPEIAEDYQKEYAELKLPSHETDWINCIYSGEKPIGDLETGIRTATICHLLNIARYLGRNLKWNPQTEKFVDDPEADQYWSREHRKGFELPTEI